MRRRGTRRRSIAVATAAAIAGSVLAVSPAAAVGGSAGGQNQRATFEIAGSLCPGDGPDGASVISGSTEATIDLVSGQLSVEVDGGATANGSASRGTWRLDPATSTGSLHGRVSLVRGRAILVGVGDGGLAGTTVRAKLDVSIDDGACDGGVLLAGTGTAKRRQPTAPVGAVQVTGVNPVDQAVADLTAAIEANPNLTLVRTVDHRAAAASRGLALGPTVEVFFGNPNLGTPLMQASQSTGIDLPQKILIWEDLFGATKVAYNAPAYLQSRHGIVGADAQLGVITNALANLAGVAAGVEVAPTFDAGQVPAGAGLVSIESDLAPEDAFAAIVAALEAAPPVNVAFALEHDANAARVGLTLDPTKLVVFGNPSLGTGLMQTRRSVALDLPQKILVSQSGDGRTVISWNDPTWVAERHGVTGQDEVLALLSGALANFASRGQ